jgi:UDP-N-acetylglucosamine--N-acetylmuramyl-(pentapeptide) pyrophosphoryl-undecaprenol N-acetylglucosamine transferase
MSVPQTIRVVIAGGGTGGHVIPALAIARELQASYNAEVMFVGTSRGIENRLVPQAGFPLKLIEVGQLNRVSFATRIKTLFALPLSVVEASQLLADLKPGVVIGVGGYASGPAMLAAILRGIPTMVFEPNLVPGMVNRRIARWTRVAAVHFAETGRWFRKFRVTGVPVRKEFFELPPRPIDGVPSLLVFGGSQGARAINDAVVKSSAGLKSAIPNLRIVHQTGQRQFDEIAAAYKSAGVEAEVAPFIENMAQKFAEADLVICRSGASTVAEIAAAGKAAIFVPLPTAADDHQRRNAESLVAQGAAMMIPEAELTRERLVSTVSAAFADRRRLVQVGEKARTLSHRDAAQQIAQMAVELMTLRQG